MVQLNVLHYISKMEVQKSEILHKRAMICNKCGERMAYVFFASGDFAKMTLDGSPEARA